MDEEKSHAVLHARHIHVAHRSPQLNADAIVESLRHQGLLAAVWWDNGVREFELTAKSLDVGLHVDVTAHVAVSPRGQK